MWIIFAKYSLNLSPVILEIRFDLIYVSSRRLLIIRLFLSIFTSPGVSIRTVSRIINILIFQVRGCLFDMTTRILGANTIIQGAVPRILRDTPPEWFASNMAAIERTANTAYEELSAVNGLRPIRCRGAMYMMVGLEVRKYCCYKN